MIILKEYVIHDTSDPVELSCTKALKKFFRIKNDLSGWFFTNIFSKIQIDY
jgi:hypothetical protein